MKPYIIRALLVLGGLFLFPIYLCCAENDRLLNPAAHVFGLVEGNLFEYRTNVLLGKGQKSPYGSDLNIFEKNFHRLSINDRFVLALIMMGIMDLQGEYSERFQAMIGNDRAAYGERILELDPKQLKTFLQSYHVDIKLFKHQTRFYLGVTPRI